MASFIKVGKTSEFADGTLKKVLVHGNAILVARVGDSYYAADSLCPHLRGDLSKGKLEGTVVTCPLQGSQFDLADGRVIRWLKESAPSAVGKTLRSPRPLKTYNVKIEGDTILIGI